MDSVRNLMVLKELGINEKNKWILLDSKAKKFLEYLSENTTKENIVNPTEMDKFEELNSKGKYPYSVDKLNKELKELEYIFPGVSRLTDVLIEKTGQDLKFFNFLMSGCEGIIPRTKQTENRGPRGIEFAYKRNIELVSQESNMNSICLRKVKFLGELQMKHKKKNLHVKESHIQVGILILYNINVSFIDKVSMLT